MSYLIYTRDQLIDLVGRKNMEIIDLQKELATALCKIINLETQLAEAAGIEVIRLDNVVNGSN